MAGTPSVLCSIPAVKPENAELIKLYEDATVTAQLLDPRMRAMLQEMMTADPSEVLNIRGTFSQHSVKAFAAPKHLGAASEHNDRRPI
jgi:hypothetical protein